MEKLPIKTNSLLTPVKLVLTGVFLVALIAAPFIFRAAGAGDIFSSEEIILNNNDGTGIASGTGTASGSGSAVATSGDELPVKLRIPKLGIDSKVQYVGLTAEGNMDTPKNASDVAWYKLGPQPGDMGSAVMAGHVNTRYTQHGVFENLADLAVGDAVEVIDADGRTLKFRVTAKKYLAHDARATEVFGSVGKRGLNLVTCTGKWLPEEKTYAERLVVFTELVS